MVAFKILTLAFAATATASTFYAPPPAVSSAVSVPGVTIVTSTVTVVGKAPSGPDPTSSIVVVSSVVATPGTPVTAVPSSSSEYIGVAVGIVALALGVLGA
ncbi:hypothetical protein SNOG_13282 [Parastagonospora nodorum SN15]|uniref:Uncharacterized protein n=1 Tax=Phaeosphaeria nodorum (strain SN15 / ATCC MYA-4574 / FGSC 10173) TaxID=321614 RepID=Q0U4N2_PHANO|nr:hypothetical protein SNOG_13282 [Parastagonospora nodorum SN15]EAT79166.1 hypothetical protein SNOG_13282 [Parastagonospora nodorum SN15]